MMTPTRGLSSHANGEIMLINLLPVTDPATCAAGYTLASGDDIVSALAHLFGPFNIHSSRQRFYHGLAQAALDSLPQNLSSTVQPPLLDVPPVDVRKLPLQKTYGSSRSQPGQRCDCGQCKVCVGNARWDRIFKEKFDSPGYYGRLVVRHSSPLA